MGKLCFDFRSNHQAVFKCFALMVADYAKIMITINKMLTLMTTPHLHRLNVLMNQQSLTTYDVISLEKHQAGKCIINERCVIREIKHFVIPNFFFARATPTESFYTVKSCYFQISCASKKKSSQTPNLKVLLALLENEIECERQTAIKTLTAKTPRLSDFLH